LPVTPRLCVAVYRRRVRASLERVWENVHDWEHLPWLHAGSFSHIDLVDSGPWGWRAMIDLEPATGSALELELVRDANADRYVARTLAGPGAGTEIWTSLAPRGEDRTDIEVEFHVPGVAAADIAAVGAAFTQLYTRLWDEDEAMMRHRAERLLAHREPDVVEADDHDLGTLEELRARVPLIVEFGRRRFRIVADADELVLHACDCPHMFGPLDEARVEDGRLRCPWHGYEFELRGGASADGRGLRLRSAPRLLVDPLTDRVRLSSKTQ
jgi:nitrite reductase/ring-hydroxylating ferredoxin subunit